MAGLPRTGLPVRAVAIGVAFGAPTSLRTLLRPGGGLRLPRNEPRFRVDELFDGHGIVIAFPQRDVHAHGQLELFNRPWRRFSRAAARSATRRLPFRVR